MASKEKNFQNFFQENLNSVILTELNEQRKTSKFCDVILKVFEGHIPAHSNVLAAGSPYISAFLAQTLPRQYSQAAPQVIELQIDDKDSKKLYQIAVQKIVDFIYTAEIELTESDFGKVLMVARILQIEKIVELCKNFANPESLFEMGLVAGAGIDADASNIDAFPPPLTDTDSEDKNEKFCNELEMPLSCENVTSMGDTVLSLKEGLQNNVETNLNSDSDNPSKSPYRGKLQDSKIIFKQSPRSYARGKSSRNVRGRSRIQSSTSSKIHFDKEKIESIPGVRKSSRHVKPNLWHIQDNVGEKHVMDFLIKTESPTKEQNYDAQQKTIEDNVMNPDDAMAIDAGSGNEDSEKHLKCNQCDYKTSNTYRYKRHLAIHAGGKYSCEHCSFSTAKLKELSIHQREHQHEQNMCSFCDHRAETNEDLQLHLARHKGPFPHFCEFCDKRFKTQTQLKFHVPKHSDEKPFVCATCAMGFKWKHALKSHMIVHSAEKNHLCDVCGYATAHKSQLKAHRLIHTGETFKCNFPGCKFQAIKKQNLKYHQLTHTREKPHQCEICGQSFSLVKNLRRHMMLHSTFKPHQCEQCTFSTTRYDKLKEHLRRQHSVGKTVNKRTPGQVQLLAEMVSGAAAVGTDVITTCAGGIHAIQTELAPVQQQVLTMNALGQAQQIIISPDQQDENSPKLTTFSLQKGQIIQSSTGTVPAATLEQLTAVSDSQSVLQTVELTGDSQQAILPSSNIVALRPVQFLEIQFPALQNVDVIDLKQDVI
ncbi:zinc finger and BTB domain-containing protein 49-like [Lineus longissimus]|uniref:zinc finger and BTB domain-containing protein 49-like n=1 Tax=Lineus longissimus TaxID=88925 RepID=UPI00315D74F4